MKNNCNIFAAFIIRTSSIKDKVYVLFI